MWDINIDFLLPNSITSSLYSSFPFMKDILSLKFKFTVAYTLAFALIIISVYSFIKTVRAN